MLVGVYMAMASVVLVYELFSRLCLFVFFLFSATNASTRVCERERD